MARDIEVRLFPTPGAPPMMQTLPFERCLSPISRPSSEGGSARISIGVRKLRYFFSMAQIASSVVSFKKRSISLSEYRGLLRALDGFRSPRLVSLSTELGAMPSISATSIRDSARRRPRFSLLLGTFIFLKAPSLTLKPLKFSGQHLLTTVH